MTDFLYWAGECQESEGTRDLKVISIHPAYTRQNGEVMPADSLPNHFSLQCPHCGQEHDFYKTHLQPVRGPKVTKFPVRKALP